LNEALKENQRLHDAILDHELGHKDTNTFKQDMAHDLTPVNSLRQKDVFLFMLKHPRTLTQFFPIYWSSKRKQLVYDLNMLLILGGMVGFIILLFILF